MKKIALVLVVSLLILFSLYGVKDFQFDYWKIIAFLYNTTSSIVRAVAADPKLFFTDERMLSSAKAISRGDTATIGMILDAGLDVNHYDADSSTLLKWALIVRNEKSLGYLIDRGADVNLPIKFTVNRETGECYYNTALWYMVRLDDTRLLETALSKGVDLDVSWHGLPADHPRYFSGTILTSITRRGNLEKVRLLVESGADVNYYLTDRNAPPLEGAISSGYFHIALYLLEHGANPYVKNNGLGLKIELFRLRHINPVRREAYSSVVQMLRDEWGIDVSPSYYDMEMSGISMDELDWSAHYHAFEASAREESMRPLPDSIQEKIRLLEERTR